MHALFASFASYLEDVVGLVYVVSVCCRGGFPRARGHGKWMVDLEPEGKVQPWCACGSSLFVGVGGVYVVACCVLQLGRLGCSWSGCV